MKISGFTIARNVRKYNYPILESIQSILPLCDEFIVNVGDSDDGTLDYIHSLKNNKIRIIENTWDSTLGKEVLSHQTNLALKECRGDWAFYLQSDEVIHEHDLPRLKSLMQSKLKHDHIDALRFRWLHFYGSYHRYRIDRGWYQKQDRIIRNNDTIESFGDAYAFRRKDGQDLKNFKTNCLLYHYGWVQPQDVMMQRRINASQIGFVTLNDHDHQDGFHYGDLTRFPAYFGSHPQVMAALVREHVLSQKDWKMIQQKYWWYPNYWLRLRVKTVRREKERIQ